MVHRDQTENERTPAHSRVTLIEWLRICEDNALYVYCLLNSLNRTDGLALSLQQAEAEAETNASGETNGTAEATPAVADDAPTVEGETAKELSHEEQQSEFKY